MEPKRSQRESDNTTAQPPIVASAFRQGLLGPTSKKRLCLRERECVCVCVCVLARTNTPLTPPIWPYEVMLQPVGMCRLQQKAVRMSRGVFRKFLEGAHLSLLQPSTLPWNSADESHALAGNSTMFAGGI